MPVASGPVADVYMPKLSDSMEEGTILKWLKSVGDVVAVGDGLVEIETDKANVIFEADSAGALIEVLANEGDTLPVGAPIARIGDPASSGDVTVAANGRVKVSPVARRIAAEHQLDLAALAGSGPGGRIVKADVERALATAAPDASSVPGSARGTTEVIPLSRLQKTVAQRMSDAKASAPHFYLQAQVDMTRCVAARARLKATASDGEPVPSINDMVVKACAIALREFPRANGAYRDGKLELYSRVNVGVAVAADDALVVPTIFDADRRGLHDVAAESRRLAELVRAGSIAPSDLAGGTFTVSNLGMFGVSSFQAVINPPQAAILAVGAVEKTPVARDGELAFAQIMGVTLSCDHRVLYGADGAKLLARIRALLEEPVGLAL